MVIEYAGKEDDGCTRWMVQDTLSKSIYCHTSEFLLKQERPFPNYEG